MYIRFRDSSQQGPVHHVANHHPCTDYEFERFLYSNHKIAKRSNAISIDASSLFNSLMDFLLMLSCNIGLILHLIADA